jgi:hypothetical protein
MARRGPPRNPANDRPAKGFVHKPARGGPANGPGQGDGWGGPLRGAGNSNKRGVFNSENARFAVTKKIADREVGIMSKADIRRQRTEELETLLYKLAIGAEREETQVSAATKLHAIYNGQPVARNLNVQADDISQLSDDELRAELARASGETLAPDEGVEVAGMPRQLPGVLH